MLTLGVLLSLLAFAVSAFLALYILGVKPKGAANRAFFVLMVSFLIWDASEAIMRSFPLDASEAEVLPWARGLWLGICLVPAALMHLALSYPEASPWIRRRGALAAVYAPYLVWVYIVLGTDWIIGGVSSNAFGPSAHAADTYLFFAIPYGIWLYASVALFLRAWWRTRQGLARRMQRLVTLGLLLGAVPAGITEAFWPAGDADTQVGLGTMYTLGWSIIIAYAIVRYRYLVIEIAPVTEGRPPRVSRQTLDRGLNYLVLEAGRAAAFGTFRDIVSTTPGLLVTALPPSRVAARFGLERTPVVWVTSASAERAVRPTGLEFELLATVLRFLRENPGTAVLLDDLDFLASVNGFDAVARVVKRITNQASASGGTVILAVGTGTLAPDELSVLRGGVDHVLEIIEAPGEPRPGNGDHVLLLVGSQETPSALAAAGARGGLLLTTEHPSKARRRFGESYEVLWVSESSERSARGVRPAALEAEAKRALAKLLAARPSSDVVLVGLEQFALFSDFPSLLAFVKDALDLATLGKCRLFVTVSPGGLPPRDIAMLARRFDVPTNLTGSRNLPPSGPTTDAPGSRILYRGPVS